jgi:hypothetical protein
MFRSHPHRARSRRSAAVLLTCAVAAVSAAACGDEGKPGRSPDERAASATVESFLRAMAAGRDAEACELMTRKLQDGIDYALKNQTEDTNNCRNASTRVLSSADPIGKREASLDSIEVSDRSATAQVKGAGHESEVILEKVGDGWKVSNY